MRTVFLILCLLPTTIFAQNWLVIQENDSQKIEMDTTEMGYEYGYYCIWFRTTKKTKQSRMQYVRDQLLFLKNRAIATDASKWMNYSYSIGYVFYDCLKKRTGAKTLIDFNDEMEAIERINFDDNHII